MSKYKWLVINNLNGQIVAVFSSWAEANVKLLQLQQKGWDVKLQPVAKEKV